MNMSQKGGMPRTGKYAAKEVSVQGVQRRESCCNSLRQLLEVERERSEARIKGIEREEE